MTNQSDTSNRLVTVDQAAELIQMSERWLYTQLQTGALTRIKLGRSTRLRLSEVEQLIQHGLRPGRPRC